MWNKTQAKILSGGKLHLELKNVQRAGFYYIQRVNDFDVTLSKWRPVKRDRSNNKMFKEGKGKKESTKFFQDFRNGGSVVSLLLYLRLMVLLILCLS